MASYNQPIRQKTPKLWGALRGITKRTFLKASFVSLVIALIMPFCQIGYVILFVDRDLGMWGATQFLDSIIKRSPNAEPLPFISSTELSSWENWNQQHKSSPIISPHRIKEIDFTVPGIRKTTMQLDLTKPILIKGFLNQSAGGNLNADSHIISPSWDFNWLKTSPQGDIMIDYVNDARVAFVDGGSIPNTRGSVRSVVSRLEAGDPVKTGTQMIFEELPNLLYELPLKGLHTLFGAYFFPSRIGKMLTVPTFISKGPKSITPTLVNDEREGEKGVVKNTKETTRTDLHCEPIANVALQFVGQKKWTLLDPSQSRGLRPALSPDGRAYVFANLPPDDDAILKLERFEVIMEAGDLLYVPTWWWHRVDYLPEVASFTVSLFHVRFDQMLKNNPLYAAVVFPNLLKELIGWKTQ